MNNDNNCVGTCGDSICSSETCSSCPSDCGYCAGDVNRDGSVNIVDLGLVAGSFGCSSGCGASDANGDGLVNILDLVLVGKNFT
jgi:hypothetical protein